jgi:hypothetical protein
MGACEVGYSRAAPSAERGLTVIPSGRCKLLLELGLRKVSRMCGPGMGGGRRLTFGEAAITIDRACGYFLFQRSGDTGKPETRAHTAAEADCATTNRIVSDWNGWSAAAG